ncbi:MAG TPA: hypothetical protein VI997_08635 [Candidatus Thermoplasmatota archaeon]|nr:hypothetical protein [Candidatus Thermoplasmatota archaeon]
MLPLDYAPQLPRRLVEALERWGRAEGLSLIELELVGQDPAVAAGFVAAARRRAGRAFLASVDTEALQRTLETRQRFPERLVVRMPDLVWL